MLLTLKYFVSLRNLFLGADWIWTFKFLCLTRQQSIPWLCFTSPGTDPLPVPHAQHSKMPLAASLPSTLCHGTLHSTAWEFLSYCLKCHPSMLAGETCALLFFSCKEIPLKSDLPCVATHLPTPVFPWGSWAWLPHVLLLQYAMTLEIKWDAFRR